MIIKRDQRREGGRNEFEGSSLPEKHIEKENPIVQVHTVVSSFPQQQQKENPKDWGFDLERRPWPKW